jgi:hypothetical protein
VRVPQVRSLLQSVFCLRKARATILLEPMLQEPRSMALSQGPKMQ